MANFIHDNDDILFYLHEGADWASLVEVTEYGFRAPDAYANAVEAQEAYREIASLVGEIVADVLAPRAEQVDREHPRVEGGEVVEGAAMVKFFDALREVELHRLCLPRELGGLNAPLLLYFLCGEAIARGDVSAMTHFSFHGGMAMAMLAYSIHEGSTTFDVAAGQISSTRFASEIEEIASGRAWGCMDITEPDAGSDMAALRTRAVQDADGNWTVTGQKIFITSGHGKFHFVIARTEKPGAPDDPFAGLGGLSMFLVKTYDEHPDGSRTRYVTIDRVEEKLGHNGSVTAALSFEDAPAQLIGARGEGFRYMLTLMNNARVGVGFESIGLAEAALRMARAYAAERRSMGKTIDQHEMIAEMLMNMDTDVRALRALAVTAAYHEEMSQKLALLDRFAGDASEEERRRFAEELPRHRATSRRLTPLLKYLAAEKAVEIARSNMQIHGGVGYTKDYLAEKLLRDALVLPVYEGTSQIQALMAMKDTLVGIIKDPKRFMKRLAETRLRTLRERDPLERGLARLQSLSLGAQQHLLKRTAADKLRTLAGKPIGTWRDVLTRDWDPKRDFALAMLHAERLIRLLAFEAIAEILVDQARRHPERRELAVRWLDRVEPEARFLHEIITTKGDTLLDDLARANAPEAAAAE